VLAVEEREPARLVLLDDEDLDPPDDGQALSADRADVSSSPGSLGAESNTISRKSGFASSTILWARRQCLSMNGPVPTGCEPRSSP
jgi:hypothetical protein